MATPAACCPVFVGRDREMAVLARVADEVARGISQLAILSGEAGAGKSRLAAEFIGSLPSLWRTTTPAGVGLSGLLLAEPQSPVTDEDHDRDLGSALARELASSHPTVMLIEDIHGLDPALIRALGVAVDLLDVAPVLLIVTLRVGDGPFDIATSGALSGLRRRARVLELTVGPLSRDAVAAMARALEATLDEVGLADVVRRSGGNAFFAEELLFAGDTPPSWTVTHTVLERVRAVDPPGRRVGELLAVAGAALPRRVVEAVVPDGATGVVTLLDAGIAVTSGVDDVGLRHALVGEVVETHLSLAERAAWHRALAASLAECSDPPAADITRHWLAAGDPAAAARWATVAADAAAAARTFATASALYTVALTVPPEDPLAHAELLERAAIAAGWAGASSVALLRATLADARFREAGQAWRSPAMWLNPTLRHLPKPPLDVPMSEGGDIAALLVAAERACLDHDHPRGAALARQALHLARQPGAEPSWETEAAYRLVRCGALAEGQAALHQQLAAVTVSGNQVLVSRCASIMTEVALTAGDIDLAIDYHRQALAAADRIGQRYWTLEVGQALLDACRGDLDEAEQRLDRLLAEDLPIATEFAQLPAAWIDLERDNLDQVGSRITRMGAVHSLGVATFTMAVLLIQARWRDRMGDPRGALDALDEADGVNADLFEPGRPDRLILRARLASQLGEVAMISDVHRHLDELIELGGGKIINAAADWAQGLQAHHQQAPREARRRLRAAAEKCEQSSRFVLAVEAWCDLAAAATTDDDRDIRLLAAQQARRIAEDRHLVALQRRIDDITGDDSASDSWPSIFDRLTPRQRDIALLVAGGRTNRQIGAELYLSEHTVRNQLVDIFARLGVSRRAELSALAARSERTGAR